MSDEKLVFNFITPFFAEQSHRWKTFQLSLRPKLQKWKTLTMVFRVCNIQLIFPYIAYSKGVKVESKDKFRDRGKKFRPDPEKKMMEQACECLRYYHYSYRTEQSYLSWIFRYIRFFGGETHPRELNADSVEKYLSHLASVGGVAAATQRQALNAIAFLYRDVLDLPLDGKIAPIRSKNIPTQGYIAP